MTRSVSNRFPVTVTQLPITRCHLCQRTVAYRPGEAGAAGAGPPQHYELKTQGGARPPPAGGASESMPSDSTSTACTANTYRCGSSPGGGAAPPNSLVPKSLRTWKAWPGSPPATPAPAGSDVTEAGRSITSQCQN